MKHRVINAVNRVYSQLTNIGLYDNDNQRELSQLKLRKATIKQVLDVTLNEIRTSELDNFFQLENIHNSFAESLYDLNGRLEHLVYTLENTGFPESVGNYETFEQISLSIELYFDDLLDLIKSYKNIPLLTELIGDEQVVILVGKNGVGKSTLVNDLKKEKFHNLFCIPAQKFLYLNNGVHNNRLQTVEEVQKLFVNLDFKIISEFAYAGANGDPYYIFSQIVDFIVREHQSCKSDSIDPRQSKLDEINEIFSKLFNDIVLHTESFSALLVPQKDIAYHLNSLSDGEKSALFYIICAVLAEEKTIFVVDEPETHLNIAICNKLWDLILEKRADCKFIFISHNSDFIASRSNPRTVWCKRYKNQNDFNLESLNISDSILSNELLIELAGSRKPILFCEGTRESLDYEILNILYSDIFLIKPVGGHINVVNFVRAARQLEFLNIQTIGLIDKDYHSEQKLEKYLTDSIYHLPVNEIEMLLMQQLVIESVLEDAVNGASFEDVKIAVTEVIYQQKEKSAANYVKYKIEEEIFMLSNIQTKENILEACRNISDKLAESTRLFDSRIDEINQSIASDDYAQLINNCNLKSEILNGVMNRFENQYQKRAVQKLKKNPHLQNYLRDLINLPPLLNS